LHNLSKFEDCDILDEGRIVSDVWLSNIGESPERIDWKDKTLMPFKNPKQFASDDRSIQSQLEDMSLVWDTSSEQPVLFVFLSSQCIAKLIPGAKPGWSLLAKIDGPLAKRLLKTS
jgi:hypothetical protein